MDTFDMGPGFNFQYTPVETLGATEYTLVTIFVDVTGSTTGYEKPIRDMMVVATEACQKSPRSDNLLIRVVLFSTRFRNGVSEVFGFKPLADVDPAQYPALTMGGGTPLYDATYNGVAGTVAYGKMLNAQDFLVNAITFIITDGGESIGASTATTKMIAKAMKESVSGEVLESHVSVLIGIDTGQSAAGDLARFQQEAGLTQFIDAGSATKAKLAKLAEFVSTSVSSQSKALGTGGPSKQISATF